MPPSDENAISSGAKSRFDDRIVRHVLQTISINGMGNFLNWHRYYIWLVQKGEGSSFLAAV
ncbi:tyrosinase central domain protein [Stemphylium lycopersici]|nr:tyrosinase central domain protein [Stemphylium lycopersici]